MKIPHQPEEIHRILGDVKAEYCFWRRDGLIIHNIYELRDSFATVKDEVFSSHVSVGKNDFASWVKDILKDAELAEALRKTPSKKALSDLLGKRITQLEHHLDAEMNRALSHQTANEIIHGKSAEHFHKSALSSYPTDSGHAIHQRVHHERTLARIILEVGIIFVIGLVAGILLGLYILPTYF